MNDPAVRTYDMTSIGRVIHGVGAFDRLASLAEESGAKRVMIASCRSIIEDTDLIDRARAILKERFAGLSEPIGAHSPAEALDSLVDLGRTVQADAIVAVGGSSVTDAAKIASLRLGGGTARIMMREGMIVQSNEGQTEQPLPLIHIPTTLSAGEYTNGAGMVEAGGKGKMISVDDRYLAWAVILDPIATLKTPGALWASSGIKAVDHAAEAVWGRASHPMGDALAITALAKLTRHLPVTMTEPHNLDARLECQLAAWMSIISMRNTMLELSHIVEHAIGAHWNLPHGITSCVGLPVTMGYLATRRPVKVAKVARALQGVASPSGDDREVALAGAHWLKNWIGSLGLPTRLSDIVDDYAALGHVADIIFNELQFFDRMPDGGRQSIRDLLEAIWDSRIG